MSEATILAALRLPSGVLSSLESGSITAIYAQSCNRPKQDFALCSDDSEASEVKISSWARCVISLQFFEKDKCDILSSHLQVSVESLKTAIEINGFIWISYLRVYHLPSSVVIKNNAKGVFLALENRIYIHELKPILDDRDFARLKQQLENLEPPESLDAKIQRMLEEVESQHRINSAKELSWIKTISKLGDRSIKEDQGKSNYQAGTDFENITKKGLEFLGFTIDEFYRGGAGGLDLFCSKPYALAAECKAGKSVPDTTVDQLQRIARRNLKENYHLAIGLIICSAEPSSYLKDSALVSKISEGIKINILNAMTLQKLVELKAKYDGAINLTELREYFQTGQIDSKIDEYIQKVEGEIKLRSRIVQAVKRLADMGTTQPNFERICTQYNAMFFKDNESVLQDPIVRDLLIELSSPLAGYLGRVVEGGKNCDRFYYLRDLLT